MAIATVVTRGFGNVTEADVNELPVRGFAIGEAAADPIDAECTFATITAKQAGATITAKVADATIRGEC